MIYVDKFQLCYKMDRKKTTSEGTPKRGNLYLGILEKN